MAKDEAKLAEELAEAKEAYRENRDDDKAKGRFRKASEAVVEARQARRVDGVGIGGDAVASDSGS